MGSQGRLKAVVSGDNLSTTAVLQGLVGAWVWEPTSTYQEKTDTIGYWTIKQWKSQNEGSDESGKIFFFQVADFIEICQVWIHIETMT